MRTTDVSFEQVRGYLKTHFVEESQLIVDLGLTRAELRTRQDAGLLPGPSYVITHALVSNFVFGRFMFVDEDGLACDGKPGVWRYYPKTYAGWIEELAAAGVMREDDLRSYHADSFRRYVINDSEGIWDHAAPDVVGEAGFEAMLENQRTHWRAGTYGVCVRPPQSFSSVFRKLSAVTRIDALLSQGASPDVLKVARAEFEACVMPFSPHEVVFSSRRRLGFG